MGAARHGPRSSPFLAPGPTFSAQSSTRDPPPNEVLQPPRTGSRSPRPSFDGVGLRCSSSVARDRAAPGVGHVPLPPSWCAVAARARAASAQALSPDCGDW